MKGTRTDRAPVIVTAWAMEGTGRAIIEACSPEEAPGKLAAYLEEARTKGYKKTDESIEEPGKKCAGLPLPYHVVHAQHLGKVLQLELYQL